MNPEIARIQNRIRKLPQEIKNVKNEKTREVLKASLNASKTASKMLATNSMRYESVPNTEMSRLINQGSSYFVNSHGVAVARKKFKLVPGQYVVFLSPPGTCILNSVLKNANFKNTFANKIKISKFVAGKMQYLKSHIWANAYKRIYTSTGPRCPDLRLEYVGDNMGIRSLPSGRFINNFNKPPYLSQVVGQRKGVFFVFACRIYFRNKVNKVSNMRMNGKKVPFRAHTHGHRMEVYENKAYRTQFVKRKRENNNNNARRLSNQH